MYLKRKETILHFHSEAWETAIALETTPPGLSGRPRTVRLAGISLSFTIKSPARDDEKVKALMLQNLASEHFVLRRKTTPSYCKPGQHKLAKSSIQCMFLLQIQQMLTYPLEDSVSQIFTSPPPHLPTRTFQMVSICQVMIFRVCLGREKRRELRKFSRLQ